jgi:hypothetical protein
MRPRHRSLDPSEAPLRERCRPHDNLACGKNAGKGADPSETPIGKVLRLCRLLSVVANYTI